MIVEHVLVLIEWRLLLSHTSWIAVETSSVEQLLQIEISHHAHIKSRPIAKCSRQILTVHVAQRFERQAIAHNQIVDVISKLIRIHGRVLERFVAGREHGEAIGAD